MTKTWARCNNYMFNRMVVDSCTVSRRANEIEVVSYGEDFRNFFRRKETEIELLCFLWSIDFNLMSSVNEFLDRMLGGDKNLVSLGDGHICQFCRSYLSAGVSKCWNCGGSVAREPLASISNFPYLMDSYSIDSSSPYEFVMVNCTLIAMGDVRVNSDGVPSGLFGDELDFLPSGYSLNPDYFVCEFCLSTVPVGEMCPRCGGERIPLSEVVKMDQHCAYCGQKVMGGVVCDSCGATLHAVAYRTLKGKL